LGSSIAPKLMGVLGACPISRLGHTTLLLRDLDVGPTFWLQTWAQEIRPVSGRKLHRWSYLSKQNIIGLFAFWLWNFMLHILLFIFFFFFCLFCPILAILCFNIVSSCILHSPFVLKSQWVCFHITFHFNEISLSV
jgi:hypothetical protein